MYTSQTFPQSLRKRNANATQYLRNRIAVASTSLRNRSTNEAQAVHKSYTLALQSDLNRFDTCAIKGRSMHIRIEIAVQMKRNCYLFTATSLRELFAVSAQIAIAVQSLHRCITAAQTLLDRIGIAT
jgi:hypothetical protein